MAAGMGLEQELRVYVSVHKHESERDNWEWRVLLKPQSPPPLSSPPTRPTSNPFTALPAGEQSFKYMSLWGRFSFKPPQRTTSKL